MRPHVVRKAADASRTMAEEAVKRLREQENDPLDLDELRRRASNDEPEPQGNDLDDPAAKGPDDDLDDLDDLKLTPADQSPPDTDQQAPRDTQDGPSVATLQDELRRSEARYHTLKAKYDVEVPRLAQDLREAKEEIKALRQRGDTAAPGETAKAVDEIYSKLEEEFPSDLVSGVRKAIEGHLQHALQRLEPPAPSHDDDDLDEIKSELRTLKEGEKERLLTQLVPKWKTLQKTREFQEHFAEEEGNTGRIRNEWLNEHWKNGDVHKVAKMFKDFITHVRQRRNGASLNREVEPNSGSGSPPPEHRGVRKFTRSEVQRLAGQVHAAGTRGERQRLSALHKKMLDSVARHGYAD